MAHLAKIFIRQIQWRVFPQPPQFNDSCRPLLLIRPPELSLDLFDLLIREALLLAFVV